MSVKLKNNEVLFLDKMNFEASVEGTVQLHAVRSGRDGSSLGITGDEKVNLVLVRLASGPDTPCAFQIGVCLEGDRHGTVDLKLKFAPDDDEANCWMDITGWLGRADDFLPAVRRGR